MKLVIAPKRTQTLSPRMMQTMRILQMGHRELQEYLEKLLLENPVLEAEQKEPPALLKKLEWLNSHNRRERHPQSEEGLQWAELAADPLQESLYQHLSAQLDLRSASAGLRKALQCVMDGLNAAGYLEETTRELAARCGQSAQTVARAEAMVQGLEPAGVGARSLSECLALQLKRQGDTGLALTIVQHHLEDMARDHYHRIARETGASREEIGQACRRIRALEPRPGAAFAPPEPPAYLQPDLVVTQEEGQLVVQPVEGYLPALHISNYYVQLMRETDDPEVHTYFDEKLRQAEWVIQSIQQRRETLMRCARAIVDRQSAFFLQGEGRLLPMSLWDIAQQVGVHPSTVSRAVRDKYIQCPQGLLPLRSLFRRALADTDISAEQVQKAIRALIQQEEAAKPLSDQKLCTLLEQQGFSIARRTVAKYRAELGYPPATGRKQF